MIVTRGVLQPSLASRDGLFFDVYAVSYLDGRPVLAVESTSSWSRTVYQLDGRCIVVEVSNGGRLVSECDSIDRAVAGIEARIEALSGKVLYFEADDRGGFRFEEGEQNPPYAALRPEDVQRVVAIGYAPRYAIVLDGVVIEMNTRECMISIGASGNILCLSHTGVLHPVHVSDTGSLVAVGKIKSWSL